MNRTLALSAVLASLFVLSSAGRAGAASGGVEQETAVARGKYLVTFGGCNDCHTPWQVTPEGPKPDMTRMLSGHPQGLQMRRRRRCLRAPGRP